MKHAILPFLSLAALAVGQVTPPPIPGTPQIIQNGNFANGTTGWQSSPPGTIMNGMYCMNVPAGGSLGSNTSYLTTTYQFLETKNDVYTLNFTASSSVGYDILVQTPDPPLDPNLNMTAALTTSPYPFSMTFSPANQAPNTTLEFLLTGPPRAATVCIGNVSMKRIDRSAWRQDYGSAIKVNQLGYLPNGPKVATFVTTNIAPMNWTLYGNTGAVSASGRTRPRGLDIASSQTVATIDFSNFTTEGTGYTLSVDDSTSYPFSISSSLYESLRADSLRFFYQQRSGIAIDGNLVGSQYARAAGHVQIPPNQGDVAVPCQLVNESLIAYLEPWTCNYTLNVTQGWYDAGDQGKYVVNGGISVAQLMMVYERTLYTNTNVSSGLGDGSLRLPERNNGIPDILDEARWELEFMLKMQVPANSTRQLFNGSMVDMSGMAHHKMHDNQWTPLPTDPSQDPKRRELHRPSTAATLNLAAAAAMAARLFPAFDATFAARCLAAAETAYAAAKQNPAILAPGTDWDQGGGAYNDNDVSDEFYWAAAELYLTTSGQQYLDDLKANRYATANVSTLFSVPSGFSWGSVAALAQMDLATVPSNVSNHSAIVQSVLTAADMLVAVQQNSSNGYGVFLTTWPWGSNSNALNNVQVVATAASLATNSTAYRTAALAGIDYVLGRNALAQSYIRTYGTKNTQNVHSRLYAHELSDLVPQAPPGAMSGGANQAASDPPADDVLQGCAPMTCYVDDVNSYSTNEVAINWGSALTWVVSWAAGQ
ncbi:glycoside hydrolase family 9 protein [Baudoinia panamericana UAMH 10762]|uniref:cellulase n=1 Tax=Baudoinia panamericana (strain UAMH 10762) TaxID=717646 RepID=M2LUF6_BAUPA|nr:glycoside hydrolase family 9 protein [Baudoinia panamericana UAMH 10762]EMC98212.1 glycoside hydrolase family 9 protein [Baudoinia panamericana UAMH 10762]